MALRPLLSVPIILALAACGNQSGNYPQKPQISLDTTLLDFGQQFNSGTYIGTQPQNSVQIQNTGQEDLVISSVGKAGDSAFTYQGPSQTTLKFLDRAFISVTFAPTQAKSYSGTLTIHSNADNQAAATVTLSGLGVTPPADGG